MWLCSQLEQSASLAENESGMFGMGLFVVSKITWLIQQTCDRVSTNTRELMEIVSEGKVGLLAAKRTSLTLMGILHLESVCHII